MSKNGGPAFPTEPNTQPGFYAHHGMSLRDWFAGQALAGLMTNESTPFSSDVAEIEPRQISSAVYDIADAMLAERAKP